MIRRFGREGRRGVGRPVVLGLGLGLGLGVVGFWLFWWQVRLVVSVLFLFVVVDLGEVVLVVVLTVGLLPLGVVVVCLLTCRPGQVEVNSAAVLAPLVPVVSPRLLLLPGFV